MIAIPTNNARQDTEDFGKNVEKACRIIVADIERQRKFNFKVIHAQINTEHCYGGGFRMDVVNEVAKRFAKEGWFPYLVRGGMYRNWTWLSVFNVAQQEGYTEGLIPNYYERVRV